MGLLNVEHCTKRFAGLTALSDVSLSVNPGEIVGIIGPNGSGKTTFFNVISGLYFPDHGNLSFDGKDIKGLKPYQISRIGISRTFQIPRPFGNASVFHNVLVGKIIQEGNSRKAREKVLELLSFLRLKERANDLANTLTIADRKRLEIAKALSTDPKLILLDEVMAGLTATEITDTIELIREVNRRGITIMVIEHIMRAIMSISNRIIVLNYGQKLAEGTPEDVANDEKVIKAYLGEEYAASRN